MLQTKNKSPYLGDRYVENMCQEGLRHTHDICELITVCYIADPGCVCVLHVGKLATRVKLKVVLMFF